MEITRLIARRFNQRSDAIRHISYDPAARPEVSSLVLLAALCLGQDPHELAARLGGGGSAALKDTVTDAVNQAMAPIRARRAQYAKDPGYLRQVLHEGNERASEIAAATLAQVRTAMSMSY